MAGYTNDKDVHRILKEARESGYQEGAEAMAEKMDKDGERLAVLEIEVRYVREAQERAATVAHEERAATAVKLVELQEDIQALRDVLTKARGVKMAFMIFGAILTTVATQVWNFLNWK